MNRREFFMLVIGTAAFAAVPLVMSGLLRKVPHGATAITGTETRRESGEDKREFKELLKRDWLEFDRRRKR
jgi:hypothetical protein